MSRSRNDGTGDSHDNNSGSNRNRLLYRDLLTRLRSLDFPEFRICILLWLRAKGYRHVQMRRRGGARGRRRQAGPDFLAVSPFDRQAKVAIQIRYWQTAIQRRTVDELRGYLLRHQIPSGLIIATSRFQDGAITAARSYPGRPIRLVTLPQLVGSMAALRLGVDRNNPAQASTRFFHCLSHLQLASYLLTNPNKGRTRFFGFLSGLNAEAATSAPEPQEPNRWWWVMATAAVLLILWLWLAKEGLR